MKDRILSISRRTRSTPFSRRVEASRVKAYTVYNHTLLATEFISLEDDYWHLCEHVQVWDVSAQRQVEISGPDAMRLVQLMTPRDIGKAQDLQGLYAPLCNQNGGIINDPIAIRHSADRWWISIADSDVKLWAQGLATGFGFDVEVFEPEIYPLAVQGPKAEELVVRLFGEQVRDIRFFRGEIFSFKGREMYVARSGWSKQGGFEIYLNDASLGEALWDELFRLGEDLNVGAGCPNLIERVESGLLSYGSDIDDSINPFECGLDTYIKLDADIEALSLDALRKIQGQHKKQLIGIIFHQAMNGLSTEVIVNEEKIGIVTSHCWSPRYRKHLAFAMMSREYLENHPTVQIDGFNAQICKLPFSVDDLNKTQD
ncbi:MAG: dimethylsulfoniopropionate demethylase [Gammaproteobacteria bacterium]|nr:dimethylsulfoniopropionate demethylase [Gammaproteobacteria bacterium]